jgi:Protein of unknown function DUF58
VRFPNSGRFYPLTLIGTPLALALLVLLGTAFATANPYAYLLSLAGLGLLILLAVSVRLQAGRIGDEDINWNSAHRVFAGRGAAPHFIEIRSSGLLPFFRIRYILSGGVYAGGHLLCAHLRSGRYRPGDDGRLELPLSLPHCGTFHASLTISVEDIFGLTRGQSGIRQTRALPVLPGVLGRPARYRIAERGAEEKNRMKESEVERYYMREYIPGDRFRDINWKASSRGDKLYTRISPLAQEETTTVTICARFHAAETGLSPSLLTLAEHQKSWIITFMLRVREEHPDFLFQLFLNEQEYLLESDEDIERFAALLGAAWFSMPTRMMPALPDEGQIYLFATSADDTLESFRAAFPKLEQSLHLTRIAAKEDVKAGRSEIFSLYPNYAGEDFPSPALVAGLLRGEKTLRRRLPRMAEEAALLPRFDTEEKRT